MRFCSIFCFLVGISLSLLACKTVHGSAIKIAGGKPTSAYPEVVRIDFFDAKDTFLGLCTGTWVSEHVILTAAHCFDDEAHPIIVGEGRNNVATRYFVNPAYVPFDSDNIRHDLALIEVNEMTAPATAKFRKSPPQKGDAVTLVGFGKTAFTDAKEVPSGKKQMGTNTIQLVENGYIRIVFETDGTAAGAAPGDSGGPLFLDTELTGVTSVGAPEGRGVFINHYVNLTSSESARFFKEATAQGFPSL